MALVHRESGLTVGGVGYLASAGPQHPSVRRHAHVLLYGLRHILRNRFGGRGAHLSEDLGQDDGLGGLGSDGPNGTTCRSEIAL